MNNTSPPHPRQPFRFFDLPYELRIKILAFVLVTDQTVDLDKKNNGAARHRINVFLTSHRLHEESYRAYYGGHTFRIFPTNHHFFGHKVRPLVARLPTRYREALVSLELRLGPGWSNPPRSWRVDDRLGLEEMEAVRIVKVFVECDPSHEIFDGFRIDRDFFTDFSGSLLMDVLQRLPSVAQVELDGWPSVKREGPLVKGLLEVARNAGVRIIEIGGKKEDDEDHDISICIARRRLDYPVELD
ncbi:MAG: hypothetical protein ALECFALPRED_006905 [Alectoria fallacina]|uniref:Uncharacterized protein n=1 Tax=Alectoria fallacina TaxID=1903189 RepID=A0A8H3G4X0_9LECA|nr:MAG: hypothetical protein ALECFALPRED_006905 [Alectoria fallacina]